MGIFRSRVMWVDFSKFALLLALLLSYEESKRKQELGRTIIGIEAKLT